MVNLHRRHVVIVNACPLCLQAEESVDHRLLNCKLAQRMWVAVRQAFGYHWVMPKRILDLFLVWNLDAVSRRGLIMWKFSFLAVFWSLWKEMKLQCFEGRSSHWQALVDKKA